MARRITYTADISARDLVLPDPRPPLNTLNLAGFAKLAATLWGSLMRSSLIFRFWLYTLDDECTWRREWLAVCGVVDSLLGCTVGAVLTVLEQL